MSRVTLYVIVMLKISNSVIGWAWNLQLAQKVHWVNVIIFFSLLLHSTFNCNFAVQKAFFKLRSWQE